MSGELKLEKLRRDLRRGLEEAAEGDVPLGEECAQAGQARDEVINEILAFRKVKIQNLPKQFGIDPADSQALDLITVL